MRISVNLTIEVDPEEWDEEYGTGTAAAKVREDVRQWARSTLLDGEAVTEVYVNNHARLSPHMPGQGR